MNLHATGMPQLPRFCKSTQANHGLLPLVGRSAFMMLEIVWAVLNIDKGVGGSLQWCV